MENEEENIAQENGSEEDLLIKTISYVTSGIRSRLLFKPGLECEVLKISWTLNSKRLFSFLQNWNMEMDKFKNSREIEYKLWKIR